MINFNDWEEIDILDNDTILDLFFNNNNYIIKLTIDNYYILIDYMDRNKINKTWMSGGNFEKKLIRRIKKYDNLFISINFNNFSYYLKYDIIYNCDILTLNE